MLTSTQLVMIKLSEIPLHVMLMVTTQKIMLTKQLINSNTTKTNNLVYLSQEHLKNRVLNVFQDLQVKFTNKMILKNLLISKDLGYILKTPQ